MLIILQLRWYVRKRTTLLKGKPKGQSIMDNLETFGSRRIQRQTEQKQKNKKQKQNKTKENRKNSTEH